MTRTTLVRAALASTAALLLGACSATAEPTAATGPEPGPPATVAPARVTRTLPDDPALMVLPATGAESRWTQGLDVLRHQVARSVAADCAREAGTALPPVPPLAFISYAELPDLAHLGRHGFGHGTEVPGTEASPEPVRVGSDAEIRRCRARGEVAGEKVREVYLPLQRLWFGELSASRRDPAAVRALRTLPGCLAGKGYRARDEEAFFALVDRTMMNANTADYARQDRALGSAYATCMRPVETVREPLRRTLRRRFLDTHAQEVRELRAALVPALRDAERTYGVRLLFPAP
ncbi:hypothetical protein ACIOKD_36680 [Streptomyces sp. NPDC087844]|uniref:hypothetical protein n=1 Tax=Streptomyces sp. NPDC087844 TaxID=3365805 RepID=UPI003814303E